MKKKKGLFCRLNLRTALVVSVLLHLFILPWKFEGQKSDLSLMNPKKIRIVLVDRKKKQVVDSEKGGRKIKPLNSRFLGENDRSFEKETIARNNGAFQEAGFGVANSQPKPQAGGQVDPKKISLADLSLRNSRSVYVPPEGVKTGARDKKGVARSSDFVEEIPLGDMTNLNTSEFRYYGFFARIKGQLEQYWGMTLREKIHSLQRAGRGPASATRMTSLRITLDKKGEILNILVKGTSGIKELDNAAIESFNRAGPFPNPPSGMLKDGRVVFDFGLVSTING